ncbi:MAG: hypothetical protein IGS03_19245 [Candidatus Sericytochromatia bacterium]|nr:hypothetical protein [Candidatus Sericytochromatia bacterium]
MPQIQKSPGLMPVQALPKARPGQGAASGEVKTAYRPDQLQLRGRIAPIPILRLVGESLQASRDGQPASLNERLMAYFASTRQAPLNQPVYAVLAEHLQQTPKASLTELEQLAFAAARQPGRSAAEVTVIAYESLMAAAIDHKLSAPDFFNGESDKVLHYLASATLTARAYHAQPGSFFGRSALAYASAYTVGLAKEILGPPFSRADMQANQQGIEAALKAARGR